MAIIFEQAKIDDLERIKELNLGLFRNELEKYDQTLDDSWTFSPEGDEYFKARIGEDRGCLFVARDNGSIIGYLAAGLIEPAEYGHRKLRGLLAELESMFVDDGYRGQKVGSGLMQAFFDWCKANNCSRIKVIASFTNSAAIEFYQRHGFDPFELILEKDI